MSEKNGKHRRIADLVIEEGERDMSDKTPRIGELFDAWDLWRRPFLTRKNWFPNSASLREVTDAELERFFAERDRQVAKRAWDAGHAAGVFDRTFGTGTRNPNESTKGEQK